ncbi:hypothetical protein BJX64DRAFT_293520 [Aspergillus heterothallicus]
MNDQTQLKRISLLKSSTNLALPNSMSPDTVIPTSRPVTPNQAERPQGVKRTEIPDFIFTDGSGRFDVGLAEEYTYSDASGLKLFEKLWKDLLQWWTWNIKLVRSLTKDEKAQVEACLAGLSEEILVYRSSRRRGQPSPERNDLFNRVAMVLNWAEKSTRRKLPFAAA